MKVLSVCAGLGLITVILATGLLINSLCQNKKDKKDENEQEMIEYMPVSFILDEIKTPNSAGMYSSSLSKLMRRWNEFREKGEAEWRDE